MIFSQRGKEFTGNNYNDIKKVYSIWICANSPNYAKNTVTGYKLMQEKIFGDFQASPRYDILDVIFVCLGDPNDKEIPDFLSMLSSTLNDHIPSIQKKKILQDNFGIPMTRELEKEVDEMCTLADAIEERGIEKGIEKGIEQGTIQTSIDNAKRFFENGASFEIVRASITALTDEKLQELYDEVKKRKASSNE